MDDDLPRWPTGRLLSAAARRVERAWDSHLEAWHLSHGSFPVLVLLARADHSQRELAAAMSVTEQTMSRMLARLERAGYLARAPHGVDRRRHVVTLLPAGREVLAAASNPRLVESVATRRLSPTQVEALRDALITLLRDDDDTAPPDASGAGERGVARREAAGEEAPG